MRFTCLILPIARLELFGGSLNLDIERMSYVCFYISEATKGRVLGCIVAPPKQGVAGINL